ncbi:MAG: phosphohydrolase [Desulfarculus sp.]|nr:phosphohydrolase [Desulfarculus sp.]
MSGQRGPWNQVHSGRAFYPLDPRPEDVDLGDIAHALANLCRYNGHSRRFYSVAEHSVHVSRALPPGLALWGLLHDAAEAYLGDFTRPLKQAVPEIKTVEDLVLKAVAMRLGLGWPCPPEIKQADLAMLAAEAHQVMAVPPRDWWLPEPPLAATVEFWPPAKAESMFRLRYLEITSPSKEAVS